MEGVEAQYNDVLAGKPGVVRFEKDTFGHQLPQADSTYEQPEAGHSILLTIDKDIQYFTETALMDAVSQFKATSGTAIVMRPSTGEILALANLPDFDPNKYNKFSDDERRNRALADVYEPGSIFKAITLAGALNERAVTPKTTYDVPDQLQVADRVIHDSSPHAAQRMNVRQIITQSSNVGTVKIGQELGGEDLDEYVHRFGFGRKTGLDFPGESPGIVRPLEDWSGSSIGNIPIGQGVAVTPLQMVSAFATIANDGVWVEPRLLTGTVGDDDEAHAARLRRQEEGREGGSCPNGDRHPLGRRQRGHGPPSSDPRLRGRGQDRNGSKGARGGWLRRRLFRQLRRIRAGQETRGRGDRDTRFTDAHLRRADRGADLQDHRAAGAERARRSALQQRREGGEGHRSG